MELKIIFLKWWFVLITSTKVSGIKVDKLACGLSNKIHLERNGTEFKFKFNDMINTTKCKAVMVIGLTERPLNDYAQYCIGVRIFKRSLSLPRSCNSTITLSQDNDKISDVIIDGDNALLRPFRSIMDVLTLTYESEGLCLDDPNAKIIVHSQFMCGGTFRGPTGTFGSPFFMEDYYPPNVSCFYDIQAPFGHRVAVNCSHFNLIGGDYLQDLSSVHSGLPRYVQSSFGTSNNFQTSNSNYQTFYFVSKPDPKPLIFGQKYGFWCTYEVI